MKVGIPKGLLYYQYYPFLLNFFQDLGAEVIVSEDTHKEILNQGTKYCVDEACLPIKIFHGHVYSLKDQCDVIVIPRIMKNNDNEFICPKFCGLPEMIIHSIPNMPQVTMAPMYANSKKELYHWAKETASLITKDVFKIHKAFEKAYTIQSNFKNGYNDKTFKLNVALAGHPYNLYDSYINMNIIKKLNRLGIGVITEEYVDENEINNEVKQLYKKPFWSFARKTYGFTAHTASTNKVDGIVYLSSFACGIDSVVIELIKDRIEDFPFLVLKIDEHTGEAGIDTRIEAFVDMLERRA